MADSQVPLHGFQDIPPKDICHQAEILMGCDPAITVNRDARTLLPPVLKRIQAIIDIRSAVCLTTLTIHTYDATFVMKFVFSH